ncbi:Nascent polypeptide-associated complex subunit beta [Modicella reniformis]|uniref:Nascent polypeptide-associated complex subunit beta n=1 Tax=Modicella reniformis TaxID=1440133 RepID=A0A9P6MAP2_9FUNG|nr:Nascent polypeptide-associated complex subunit beta [Modicella reniformis]
MFLESGSVITFRQPKVQASAASNTYAIYGRGEEKDMSEYIPNILNQLGPDSMASLRKLAETYQKSAGGQSAPPEDDDDEVPDLIESFEDASVDDKKDEEPEAKEVEEASA